MYKGWRLVRLRLALPDPKPGTCRGCRSRLWPPVHRSNVRSDPPQLQKIQMLEDRCIPSAAHSQNCHSIVWPDGWDRGALNSSWRVCPAFSELWWKCGAVVGDTGELGHVWYNTTGTRVSPGLRSGPTQLEGDTLSPTLLEQLYNSGRKWCNHSFSQQCRECVQCWCSWSRWGCVCVCVSWPLMADSTLSNSRNILTASSSSTSAIWKQRIFLSVLLGQNWFSSI